MIKQRRLDSDDFEMISGTELGVAFIRNKYLVSHAEVLDFIDRNSTCLFHIKNSHASSNWYVYFESTDDANRVVQHFSNTNDSNVTPLIERVKPSVKN